MNFITRTIVIGAMAGVTLSLLSFAGSTKYTISMGRPFRQIQLDMNAQEAFNIIQRAGSWCGDYRSTVCTFSDIDHYYKITIDPATDRVARKIVIRRERSLIDRFLDGYRLLIS